MTSSDNDLVLTKHFESLTTNAKRYILAEILDVTSAVANELANIGGGSVFNGATSAVAGTSGIVPAPTPDDYDKFLCGNGTWTAIPGGSGSSGYPIASASNAGLMSAEDKQHLDALFLDTADLTDAVITVVGGNFLPSVDNISDFNSRKNSNLPYFENPLKHVINSHFDLGNCPPFPSSNRVTLQNGNAVIYVDEAQISDVARRFSLVSDGFNGVSIGVENATLSEFFSPPYKISESVGFVIQERVQFQNTLYSTQYDGISYIQTFRASANGNVAYVGANSICNASSSVVSAHGTNAYYFLPSLLDPNHILFAGVVYAENASGYSNYWRYTTIAINAANGSMSRTKAMTDIGVYYTYDLASKTTLVEEPEANLNFPKLKFSFDHDSVTIAKDTRSGWITLPFIKYQTKVTNASKVVTGGGEYILIHHGAYGAAPALLQHTTLAGGVDSTINAWLEDDDNLIAGCWKSRSSEKVYAITFKMGTYPTASDKWFDSAATVWLFDFLTPKVLKTNTKLSDVLNDLVI